MRKRTKKKRTESDRIVAEQAEINKKNWEVKLTAVRRQLRMDPDRTDSAIAELVGVGESTVRQVREGKKLKYMEVTKT